MGRVARLLLLLLGLGLLTTGAVIHPAHVEAVRVNAIAQATLTPARCSSASGVPVTFLWHDTVVTAQLQSPNCAHGITAGKVLTVYVQSDEPTTVGPDANWILNPDTHDPFDFIGPNGLRG